MAKCSHCLEENKKYLALVGQPPNLCKRCFKKKKYEEHWKKKAPFPVPPVDREKLTGDSLDLGEIIAEELVLSLDPYPRKPGIALETGPGGEAGEPRPSGPFEALAALKRKE